MAPEVRQVGKQKLVAFLSPGIGGLASVTHLKIARVQGASETRLLVVVEKPNFRSAVNSRLIDPANRVSREFPELHRPGEHAG